MVVNQYDTGRDSIDVVACFGTKSGRREEDALAGPHAL